LALHLITEHCGPVVAARVAQRMAVAMRRGPNDPQLSPFLSHRQHLNGRLHALQDAIAQDPHARWDAHVMADLACTTPRTLHRMFVAHAGIAPLAYVRRIRLAHAQTALAAGSTVQQAALTAGFSSDLQLRRAWVAEGVAGMPSQRGARERRQGDA
jgi:transcriptional regulator GlxA family with amidase domain